MRIIGLRSVGLGDSFQSGDTGNYCPCELTIGVGYPMYGETYDMMTHERIHNGTDVVSIDLDGANDCYKVTTVNKHIHIFPKQAYIAEWAPEEG
jgi:hypothetical protein